MRVLAVRLVYPAAPKAEGPDVGARHPAGKEEWAVVWGTEPPWLREEDTGHPAGKGLAEAGQMVRPPQEGGTGVGTDRLAGGELVSVAAKEPPLREVDTGEDTDNPAGRDLVAWSSSAEPIGAVAKLGDPAFPATSGVDGDAPRPSPAETLQDAGIQARDWASAVAVHFHPSAEAVAPAVEVLELVPPSEEA